MKKDSRFMKFTSIMSVIMFFAASLFSCGGGGGGGAPGPTNFTSADQAGSAASGAMAGFQLTGVMVNLAGSMAYSSIPAPAAPSLKAKPTGTSDLAKLDPRLKDLMDRLVSELKSSVLQGAVKKARELGAKKVPVSGTIPCGSGSITYLASDTSTVDYMETDITYTFNACRNSISYTYTELTGSLQAYDKLMNDYSSETHRLTASNFTYKWYSDGTFTTVNYTDVLNATINANFDYFTASETGAFSVNGSYTSTNHAMDAVMAVNFNGINATMTYDYVTDTEVTVANGGFGFNVSDSGVQVIGLSVSYTNLEDKWQYLTDTYFTVKNWINGRISVDWAPDELGCVEGVFDFTTPDATPLTFDNRDFYSCPFDGTVTVNNATFDFGVPSGYQITVTVGTNLPEVYADCSALDVSMCTDKL